MGNTLDTPNTEKKTDTNSSLRVQDDDLSWGVSSMQGWRISMEDAHSCLQIDSSTVYDDKEGVHVEYDLPPHHYLFCVFDGHGGTFAAKFASEQLIHVLRKQASFHSYVKLVGTRRRDDPSNADVENSKRKKKKGKTKRSDGAEKRREKDPKYLGHLLQEALEDAFVETDRELLKVMISKGLYKQQRVQKESTDDDDNGDDWGVSFSEQEIATVSSQQDNQTVPADEPYESGTTATAVLVTPDFMICSNAGDSRAVLSSPDTVPLSMDHKPDLPAERGRIERAGGMVNFGRVDGVLAMSRALGDFGLKAYPKVLDDSSSREEKREVAKELKVSPFPDVVVRRRTKQDKVLVVACDGIWDVLKNEECLELTKTLLAEGESNMGLIAEEILDVCLKKGSRDNMTIIVVKYPGQVIGKGGGVAKRRRNRM